jgi:hypothetical protein
MDGLNLYEYERCQTTNQLDSNGTDAAFNLLACDGDLVSCVNDAGINLVAIGNCNHVWADCYTNNLPPFTPLNDKSPECDNYKCTDSYVGSNAACFCKCAGNSDWSQYVRGCLRMMYVNHWSAASAHFTCCQMASAYYPPPVDKLAECYKLCAETQLGTHL